VVLPRNVGVTGGWWANRALCRVLTSTTSDMLLVIFGQIKIKQWLFLFAFFFSLSFTISINEQMEGSEAKPLGHVIEGILPWPLCALFFC
jgi:hypothetical protein